MQRSLRKFLLLLAGSGLSAREIVQIAKEMRNLQPSRLADFVQSLRDNAVDQLDMVVDSSLRDPYQGRGGVGTHHPKSDVATRVEALLREEAGLTVGQAALQLLRSLEQDRSRVAVTIKPPNKESLNNWLQKVERQVGSSELLHHATLVRNRYTHRPHQDWPLRDE